LNNQGENDAKMSDAAQNSGEAELGASGLGSAPLATYARRSPSAHEAATRHSQRVRFLRRAIVMTCFGVAALIAFFAIFDPLKGLQLGFTFGRVGLEGTKITMERPRLTGVTNDGQPFEVGAAAVTQDTTQPKIFDLKQIDARLGSRDGDVKMTAAAGRYDSGPDLLTLQGPVRVVSQGRYELELQSADVDMRAGRLTSDKPVEGKLPNAKISADSVVFIDPERRATFEGRVRTIFENLAPTPDAAPLAEAGSAAPEKQQ
jgi:lipopolysaccharide export system protein LptC